MHTIVLCLTPKSGALYEPVDRELGQELLDPQRTWQLGQFIYEKLSDRHPLEELKLGVHSRVPLGNITITPGVDGPIWQSVVLSGSSEGFRWTKV